MKSKLCILNLLFSIFILCYCEIDIRPTRNAITIESRILSMSLNDEIITAAVGISAKEAQTKQGLSFPQSVPISNDFGYSPLVCYQSNNLYIGKYATNFTRFAPECRNIITELSQNKTFVEFDYSDKKERKHHENITELLSDIFKQIQEDAQNQIELEIYNCIIIIPQKVDKFSNIIKKAGKKAGCKYPSVYLQNEAIKAIIKKDTDYNRPILGVNLDMYGVEIFTNDKQTCGKKCGYHDLIGMISEDYTTFLNKSLLDKEVVFSLSEKYLNDLANNTKTPSVNLTQFFNLNCDVNKYYTRKNFMEITQPFWTYCNNAFMKTRIETIDSLIMVGKYSHFLNFNNQLFKDISLKSFETIHIDLSDIAIGGTMLPIKDKEINTSPSFIVAKGILGKNIYIKTNSGNKELLLKAGSRFEESKTVTYTISTMAHMSIIEGKTSLITFEFDPITSFPENITIKLEYKKIGKIQYSITSEDSTRIENVRIYSEVF